MLVRNGFPKEMGVQSNTKSVRVQDASQLVLIRGEQVVHELFHCLFHLQGMNTKNKAEQTMVEFNSKQHKFVK